MLGSCVKIGGRSFYILQGISPPPKQKESPPWGKTTAATNRGKVAGIVDIGQALARKNSQETIFFSPKFREDAFLLVTLAGARGVGLSGTPDTGMWHVFCTPFTMAIAKRYLYLPAKGRNVHTPDS